jgi:hypothetical protein
MIVVGWQTTLDLGRKSSKEKKELREEQNKYQITLEYLKMNENHLRLIEKSIYSI